MRTPAPLGEFEVVVLMAVLHGADDAYGSAVRDAIEARTGRPASRGAVYVTLDRLETKGLLSSRMGDATPQRGGRPKRVFRVTASGLTAIKHAVSVMAQMVKGLEPIVGNI